MRRQSTAFAVLLICIIACRRAGGYGVLQNSECYGTGNPDVGGSCRSDELPGSRAALRNNTKEKPMYPRILVPLDGSATSERGLREAISLARELKSSLLLLHVVDDFSMLVEMSSRASYDDMVGKLRNYGEWVLARSRGEALDAGIQSETLMREVTRAAVGSVIVEVAAEGVCSLIVMGTHGRRGFSRLTLGSAAEQTVRSSRIPVLLIHDESPQ